MYRVGVSKSRVSIPMQDSDSEKSCGTDFDKTNHNVLFMYEISFKKQNLFLNFYQKFIMMFNQSLMFFIFIDVWNYTEM